MKRITALALLLICALTPCAAQQKEKRLPGPFLIRGPVHVIRDERATITNIDGKLVEGARLPVLTITFSEDGMRQEQTFYLPDGIGHKRGLLYNQDGRILETTEFNAKGDVQLRSVNKYDDQKRLVESVMLKSDGSIFRKNTYVYQVNSPVTEIIVYDQNGTVVSRSTMTKGVQKMESESYLFGRDRTIKSESLSTPGPGGGRLYERRVDGNVLSREEFLSGEKDGPQRIIYNADGTIKSKERYEREFDAHGNIIKMVRLVAEGDSADFKPVDVTYRTIEYY
jgi:antitoxin component YwqK of YwqJK toxin-antitoxin module